MLDPAFMKGVPDPPYPYILFQWFLNTFAARVHGPHLKFKNAAHQLNQAKTVA